MRFFRCQGDELDDEKSDRMCYGINDKQDEVEINQNRSNKYEDSRSETRFIPILATRGAILTPRNLIASEYKTLTPGDEEGSPCYETNQHKQGSGQLWDHQQINRLEKTMELQEAGRG